MHPDKRQFNIYLPAELIKRVKHAALDADASLSDFVERALASYLETIGPETIGVASPPTDSSAASRNRDGD